MSKYPLISLFTTYVKSWFVSRATKTAILPALLLLLPGFSFASSMNYASTAYVETPGADGFIFITGECTEDECDIRIKDGSKWELIRTAKKGSFTTGVSKPPGTYTVNMQRCTLGTMYGQTHRVWCSGGDFQKDVKIVPVPAKPKITLPATSSGAPSVRIAQSVANASSYDIYSKKINASTWSKIGSVGAGKAIAPGRPSGSYHYAAKACNAGGGCSYLGAAQRVDVARKPENPPNFKINKSSPNDGSFTVSWGDASIPGDSAAEVTRYYVARQLDSGSSEKVYDSNGNSFSDALTTTGKYTYKIRAIHVVGQAVAYSNWVELTTEVDKPDKPALTLSAETSTNGSFSLAWPTQANTTSYSLEQSVDGGSWTAVDQASPYAATEKPSGRYRYRLRVDNRVGHAYSDIKAIDVALTPVLTGITVPIVPTDGQFEVAWDDLGDGATDYELQQSLDGGENWTDVESAITKASHPIVVNAAGDYRYQVRARKEVGRAVAWSEWQESEDVVVAPPAETPSLEVSVPFDTDLQTHPSDNGRYTVSWDGVPNTSEYEFQEQKGSAVATDGWISRFFCKPSEESCDNGHAENYTSGNGTYHHRVRACNRIGCTAYTPVKTVDVAIRPNVPTSISPPEAAGKSFPVEWGTAGGSVTSYKLFRWNEAVPDSKVQVYDRFGQEHSEDGDIEAGRYRYAVSACRKTRDVEHCSDERVADWATVVLAKPDMPETGFTATVAGEAIQLDWSETAEAISTPVDHFKVYYGVDEEPWPEESIYKGDDTSKLFEDVTVAEVHRFALEACTAATTSKGVVEECSIRNEIPPPVTRPKGVPLWKETDRKGAGDFVLSWTYVHQSAYYKLEKQTDTGEWADTRLDPSDKSQGFGNMSSGRHRYRVTACNFIGCHSESSAELLVDIAREPDAPSWANNLTLSAGKHTLSWYPVASNVTHYELQQSSDNGVNWEVVDDSIPHTETSRTAPVLEQAGTYLYRVMAHNQVGDQSNQSGWSEAHAVRVAAPEIPANVRISDQFENNFDIVWDKVPNSEEYKLVEQGSGKVETVEETEHPYQTELISSVSNTAEGSYTYTVQACNAIGCSEPSAPASVSIIITPGEPGPAKATADYETGQTTVSWGESPDSPVFYRVWQLQNNGSASGPEMFNVAGGNWPNSVDSAGTYSYKVRACRTWGSYTECSDPVVSNDVIYALPQAPALDAPVESTSGAYTVSWNRISNASGYELDENDLRETTAAITKTFAGSSAKSGGRYVYKVRACNVLGCGDFSEDRTVLVRTGGSDSDGGSGGGGAGDGYNVVSTPPSGPAPGNPVGATAGEFRVNEAGAATYSIPLSIPKGTADVAPQLSLNYSSQGGNGTLGQGWSLGGLSSISRCRQTLSQDGIAKPITWSSQDRFCLDGQRLILVKGSAYGAAGAVYKTEIDSFVRVTSHGGTTGHPDYFKVEAKDGSTSFYGGSADGVAAHAHMKAGSRTLTWALSRFRDSVGNRIDFHYTGNADSGQRISKINYAYPSINSSSSPGATVEFGYEDRPDTSSSYVAGHKFHQTKRLASITVNNRTSGGSLAEYRRYDIEYQFDSVVTSDHISRLKSVQECVQASCLPATTFEWPELKDKGPDGQTFWVGDFAGSMSSESDRHVLTYQHLDINGDGKQDLVWVDYLKTNPTRQYMYYALATADGYTKRRSVGAGIFSSDLTKRGGGIELHVIDYNADGRQDIVAYQKDGAAANAWRLFLATAAQSDWTLSAGAVDLPFTNNAMQFGDIDSDGLADAYYVRDKKLYVHHLQKTASNLSSPSRHYKFASSPKAYAVGGLPPLSEEDAYWEVQGVVPGGVGDFNGDGRADLLLVAQYYTIEWHTGATEEGPVGHGPQRIIALADGEKFTYMDEVAPGKPRAPKMAVRLADLNGDGLTDVVYRRSGNWNMRLSNGKSFTSVAAIENAPVQPNETDYKEEHHVYLIDINRDGHPDLVWTDAAKGVMVQKWVPESERFASTPIKFSGAWAVGVEDQTAVFDIDGDGWTDVIRFNTGDSKWSSWLSNHRGTLSPDLLTRIKNGLGNVTDISYQTLTNSNHYSRVKVGDVVVTEQLEETCTEDPPDSGSYRCYAPTQKTLSTADFYKTLNNPFSTLPEDNEHLSEAGSPVLEIHAPIPVVTEVASSAPVPGNENGKVKISYYYDQMKFQAAGRGSLGFRRLITVDQQTGVVTETEYRQDWPFIGSPLKTVVKSAAGHTLSHAVNTWGLQEEPGTHGKYYQPYIRESVEKSYVLSDNGNSQGGLLKRVTTTNVYDKYGNAKQIEAVTQGGGETVTKLVKNTYGTGEDAKRLGRLSRTVVTTERGSEKEARTSSFHYFSTGSKKNLLHREVIDPEIESEGLALTTTYRYDDYGNKIGAVQTAKDGSRRESETSTYANGRYITEVRNAFGDVTRKVISRNKFGAPTRVRDINGVETTLAYDDLGREYLRQDSTGAWSWTGLRSCEEINCAGRAAYRIEERVAGGGRSYVYKDRLGRTVRETTLGFDGTAIHVDTHYDRLSRVKRVSTPHTGTPAGWTENTYDILGRVTSIRQPDGTTGGTTRYNGYTTIITNALGHTKHETRDLLGQLTEVVDNLRGEITYAYDLGGNLIKATTDAPDADPVTVRMCYDKLGRKVAMHDPDKGGFLGNASADCGQVTQEGNLAGWWHYHYNGIGDLLQQRDTKGQVRSFTYDDLGRRLTRTDRTADNSVESHTRWYYDGSMTGVPAPGDLGNVTLITQSYGRIDESCNENNHCTLVGYDLFGRKNETITFLPGESDGYHHSVYYDSIGRPYVEQDAAQAHVMPLSGVRQRYNDYGYKSEVIDLASNDSLYRINSMDTWGNVTSETRGEAFTTRYYYDPYFGRLEQQVTDGDNSSGILALQDITYTWDDLGNLTSRHNQSATQHNTGFKDLRESFCYDGLNRLTKSHKGTLNGSCSLSSGNQDVEYDGLGNITRKADVGAYSYGNNAGPHAVTNAGGMAYTYDRNGNMVSGDGRTLKYNTHDKPVEISRDGHKTEFRYGPDRSRYLRVDTKNNVRTTTLYLGKVERIYTEGEDTVTWRRTVAGAVLTLTTDLDNNLQETEGAFIFKDHLGSTDVIAATDGTVLETQSFDSWGQRRNGDSWRSMTPTEWERFVADHAGSAYKRGYTGHEHMDELGLIHMNGRVYDPKLARFLQADPLIQAASNTQSYNRYSYTWNNPLNATDPSGYSLKSLYKDLMKVDGRWTTHKLMAKNPAASTFVQIALNYIPIIGPFVSAHYSADAAFYSTGSIRVAGRQFMTSAVAAFAFSGIGASGWNAGQQIFASAMVGGVMAELQGGKFGHGFIAAGIGVAVGAAGLEGPRGFIVATVAGGVSSAITGGKFANGAATAAFTWALSQGARSVANGKGSNSFAEQGESEFYTIDENGNKTQTMEQRRKQLRHLGVKEGRPSRSETAEISAILSTDEFQAIADPIADAALECGCEPTALRVTEIDGTYFVDRIGQGTSGLKIDFIPEPLGFRSWRHVFDWHPHPSGASSAYMPSPHDLLTSQSQGTNNVIWYGDGKHTIYRGR